MMRIFFHQASFTWLPALALSFFFLVFLALMWRLYKISSKQDYQKLALLPLEDERNIHEKQ